MQNMVFFVYFEAKYWIGFFFISTQCENFVSYVFSKFQRSKKLPSYICFYKDKYFIIKIISQLIFYDFFSAYQWLEFIWFFFFNLKLFLFSFFIEKFNYLYL